METLGKPYMETLGNLQENPLRKSQNKNYKIFYFWVLLGRFLDTNLLFSRLINGKQRRSL